MPDPESTCMYFNSWCSATERTLIYACDANIFWSTALTAWWSLPVSLSERWERVAESNCCKRTWWRRQRRIRIELACAPLRAQICIWLVFEKHREDEWTKGFCFRILKLFLCRDCFQLVRFIRDPTSKFTPIQIARIKVDWILMMSWSQCTTYAFSLRRWNVPKTPHFSRHIAHIVTEARNIFGCPT